MKQPAASTVFGFETFWNPNQAPWSTAPQQQAAPQPVDPPPPYVAYSMHPSLTDFGKQQSAL